MTTIRTSLEATILDLLQRRGAASAVQIGISCLTMPGDVRACLVMLESLPLVSGRHDASALTDEGRRQFDLLEGDTSR